MGSVVKEREARGLHKFGQGEDKNLVLLDREQEPNSDSDAAYCSKTNT